MTSSDGSVRIRAAFTDAPPADVFGTADGVRVRMRDGGNLDRLLASAAVECATRGTRTTCQSADRRVKAAFKRRGATIHLGTRVVHLQLPRPVSPRRSP